MPNRNLRFWFALLFAVVAITGLRADDFDLRYQAVVDSKGKQAEAQRLADLFKTDWDYEMSISPESATIFGVLGLDANWTDLSPKAIAQRKQNLQRPLHAIQSIDRAKLGPIDQVSCDLFKNKVEDAIEGSRFTPELAPITQLDGIHQDAAQLLAVSPSRTVPEFENQVTRLRARPKESPRRRSRSAMCRRK